MHILFAVPYVPNLIRTRPYNFVNGLLKRGHRLTLVTLWENEQEREVLATLSQKGVKVIAARLTKVRSMWNAVRALPTSAPLQASYCWQPVLLKMLGDCLNSDPANVIHIEHLRGARLGLWIKSYFAGACTQPPIVWDSVDCISHLFEQAARQSRSLFGQLITRLELNRTRSYEGWLVDQFHRVLVTSIVDQSALERLASSYRQSKRLGNPGSAKPVNILPNGVDLDFFTPMAQPKEPATIVFSGKMSYHANVTASLFLVNDIMPHVWDKKPNTRVQIVGHRPPAQVVELGRKFAGQVEVTGTVPDVRPYLAKATVATAPILYGAGIQNKVLEAMAMTTPVVATSQAVSAISVNNGNQVLLGDSPKEFAQQIVCLLDDAGLRERVARNGRHYVESNHDWNRIVEKLEKIYVEELIVDSVV